MLFLVWIAVIIAAVVIEAITVSLVSIWFVPGAVIAMVLSFCNVQIYIQILVFALVSIVTLVLSKCIFKVTLNEKASPTNADAVIGQVAVVTETIDNVNQKGAVKVLGKEWSARSNDNSTIEVGTQVKVIEIKGVKLICQTLN
ncbi:MAG: NfeD family protein [Clostridia bacterium]|nr:NfeD family protein [Clostridia bacterium]